MQHRVDAAVDDGVVSVAILYKQFAWKRELAARVALAYQAGDSRPALQMNAVTRIRPGLKRGTGRGQQCRIRDSLDLRVGHINVDVFKDWLHRKLRANTDNVIDLAALLPGEVDFSAFRPFVAFDHTVRLGESGQRLHRVVLLAVDIAHRDQVFVVLVIVSFNAY